MCKFFSFVGDGFGNYKYLDWEFRKDSLDESNDSHTFILTHFKIPPKMQDKWSKYEYNPITKQFTIDEGVEGHDHESAEAWVDKLNFKDVVPHLIIKDIVSPLFIENVIVTQEDIELLKKRDSVWASVRASVGDSVRASVWASVGAQIGSLFRLPRAAWKNTNKIKTKGYPFQPAVDLWRLGLVPSFDGTTWHLHGGPSGLALFSITQVKLRGVK